jgi:hypothetical protein
MSAKCRASAMSCRWKPSSVNLSISNGLSVLHEFGLRWVGVTVAVNPPSVACSLGADDGTTCSVKVTRICNNGFAECHERETDCDIRRTTTREYWSWRF